MAADKIDLEKSDYGLSFAILEEVNYSFHCPLQMYRIDLFLLVLSICDIKHVKPPIGILDIVPPGSGIIILLHFIICKSGFKSSGI